MSADRAALLVTSIKKRLVDGQRHLAALERGAAQFGDDFDLTSFEAAWTSDDPEMLNRAYAVQAGYENVINTCIKVGEELAALEGWSNASVQPTSIQTLKLLHENGIISAKTRTALKEAQERRSDVQHDYANVAARDIHASTRAVLEHAPLLFQDVAAALRHRR